MKSACPHFFGPLLQLFCFLIMFCLLSGRAAAVPPVQRFDLTVSFDLAAHSLRGTMRCTPEPGEPIILHAGELEIKQVLIGGVPWKPVIDQEGMLALPASAEGRPVEIAFARTMTRDDAAEGSMIDSSGVVLLDLWYPAPVHESLISLSAEVPADFYAVSEADEITYQPAAAGKKVSFVFDRPVSILPLIAGPYQMQEVKTASGVVVATYFFPEDHDLVQQYSDKTVEYLARYEKLIGPYPYKRYSVVENRLPTGFAMPTFTLLGQSVVRLPFITHTSLGHEVLHSWFGNAVGVDYTQGNWCEGLVTYLADQSFAVDRGEGVDFRKEQLVKYQSLVGPDNTMTVADFKDAGDYGISSQATRTVGYNKGSMIFDMLRHKIGDEAFYSGLRSFYSKEKYHNASWTDLQHAFQEAAGVDLTAFFEQWLHRADVPDLGVQRVKVEVKDGAPELTFDLMQRTERPYELTVLVQVEVDGKPVRQQVEVRGEKTPVAITLAGIPTTMELDPDYNLMRWLVPDELPAVWSRFQGGTAKLVVLEKDSEEKFAPLRPLLEEMGCTIVKDGEFDQEELAKNNLLLFGIGSKASLGLFARPAYPATGFTLEVRNNPLTPTRVAVLMQAADVAQVQAVVHKLNHYGKYGYLHFENGTNTEKKIPETDYGIGYILEQPPRGVAVSRSQEFAAIMDSIADSRVIYVGETHVSPTDHFLQYQVIEAMHNKNPDLAIGMEMFNRSSQPALDAYIRGEIDERQFLRDSHYFENWGFDYRLYRDILQFARRNKVPVIGLNLDKDIVNETFQDEGIAGLPKEMQEKIPEQRDLSMPGYRERLVDAFLAHSGPDFTESDKKLSTFIQAQVLWDETMAQSVCNYLTDHPASRMIVIAGAGHVVKENAIPPRVERRIPAKQTILVNAAPGELDTHEADYIFFSEPVTQPPAPMLGVLLEEKEGGLTISGFTEMSGAKAAKLAVGDVILSLDGEPVHTVDDVRIFLLYKKHGSKVEVKVRRPVFLLPDAVLDFEVRL